MIESKRKTNGGSEPRIISSNARQWMTSNRGRRDIGRNLGRQEGNVESKLKQQQHLLQLEPQPRENLRFCDGPSSRS
jgi:hypothetical protein